MAESEAMFKKDMTIHEILRAHPQAAMVMASYHLGGCSHCAIGEKETLEQVCAGYGLPADELLAALNDLPLVEA